MQSTLKFIFSYLFVLYFIIVFPNAAWAAPSISSITDNSASYPQSKVPKYEKFEVRFSVATQAKYPYLPYTEDSYNKLPAGSGVTVDGVFISPDGQEFAHPAFYKQEFVEEVKGGKDWYYPKQEFSWVVRFSPHKTGSWQYKLKARDTTGISESSPMQFEVTESENKGFINVSKKDFRYFEYDDGSYFPAQGYNAGYLEISPRNPNQTSKKVFQYLSENHVTLIRDWWTFWSLSGFDRDIWLDYKSIPYQPSWFWLAWDEGMHPSSALMSQVWRREGEDTCMIYGSYGDGNDHAIKRNALYRLRVRYKVVSMDTTPLVAGYPIGFAVKGDGWMYYPDSRTQHCNWPTAGRVLIASYTDPSGQNLWQNSPDAVDGSWTVGQADVTFPDKDFLPTLNFTLQNTNLGRVLIDELSLRELGSQGEEGVDVITRGDFDVNTYTNQQKSYGMDKVIQNAWEKKVYIRPVIIDKHEAAFTNMNHDGQYTWPPEQDYFYGNGRNMTKGRFLHMVYWRYIQARWGYSPAIHSWELLNEGDPVNSNHYVLTDELGKFMKCGAFGVSVPEGDGQKCTYDHPNAHPVTTSTWHSYPIWQFWQNSKYPNVDYSDFHNYIPSNSPTYFDTGGFVDYFANMLTTDHPQTPFTLGEVGFYSSGNTNDPTNDFARDTEGVWLHNYLWSTIHPRAYIPLYWYSKDHINNPIDKKHNYKNIYNFLYSIPLSNGNYKDLSATNTNTEVRVVGQKDVVNGNAHMWIQNKKHTWKNVIDSVAITPQSGSIEINGFTPSTAYTIFEWDTYSKSDDPNAIVKRNWQVTSDTTGKVTLEYQNLISDTAYVITKDGRFPFDMTGATPPTCTQKGDVDCNSSVNILDLSLVIRNFGASNATRQIGDVSGDGFVNISDLSEVIREFGKTI